MLQVEKLKSSVAFLKEVTAWQLTQGDKEAATIQGTKEAEEGDNSEWGRVPVKREDRVCASKEAFSKNASSR